jgi:hypothetical protein
MPIKAFYAIFEEGNYYRITWENNSAAVFGIFRWVSVFLAGSARQTGRSNAALSFSCGQNQSGSTNSRCPDRAAGGALFRVARQRCRLQRLQILGQVVDLGRRQA